MQEVFLYERRKDKGEIKLNLAFAFPQIESFALASVGYLSIFKMLDNMENIFVERIYLDTTKTEIFSNEIDVMGFSISFEMDFMSLIKMLKKYSIPLKASERRESDPIIFAGGPVLMANPIPYQDFFDFIAVGEKVCLVEAIEVLKNKRTTKKDEILKQLSNIKGIYVPKYPKPTEIVRDNMEEEILFTPILSEKSFFKDTIVIEVERGCPKLCNFCLASWLNLPVRFVPYEKIIKTIDFALQYTNKIALLGAYVAGHPRFDDIMKHISNIADMKQIELSLSSLRADLADEDIIKTLVKCGQKTATIALEAGSKRLRDFINKNLSDEDILKTIEIAQKGGLKGIKIYTMLSLPTEGDEDVEALVELVKKMKAKIKENIKQGFDNLNLTISTSTFIPKANTPFEDFKRQDKKIIEKRISYLKKEFHKLGVNFRCSSVDWDEIQAFLSTAKVSLVDFLVEVSELGGNLGAFKKAFKKFDFENIPENDWNFILTGANKQKEIVKSKIIDV